MDKKDIEHLARLARIEVSDTEKEKLAQDLQAVLAYVKTLQEADTGDELFTHFEHLEASLRDDLSSTKDMHMPANLMNVAPETENGYVKVKNILEK